MAKSLINEMVVQLPKRHGFNNIKASIQTIKLAIRDSTRDLKDLEALSDYA